MNVIFRPLQFLLARLGHQIVPFNRRQVIPDIVPDQDLYTGPEDFSRLFRPWRGKEFGRFLTPEITNNTMLSRQKLYWLFYLCQQTNSLQGDIFEAGVGSGGSARLMLDGFQRCHIQKQMWLLDTFEGYQKVDAKADGSHVRIDQCRCNSKEDVERLLTHGEFRPNIIKGLIPSTLAKVTTDKIAFAHIDVNLYEPTLEATKFCLERLVPGGIILFDDYGWPSTYGARRAIDEVCAVWKQSVICVPESTQAFLIKTAT
jgi:O-methyltransferase